MIKKVPNARIAHAIMLAVALGQMSACSESSEKRKELFEKERDARIESERSKFVARYPGSIDFDQFRKGFVRRFSIDLQRAVEKRPDQVYWLEEPDFVIGDVLSTQKGIRFVFTLHTYGDPFGSGSCDFSLDCSEELLVALKETKESLASALDRDSYGTCFLAFTISGIHRVPFRGEEGDDPVVANEVKGLSFSGTLLGVHRVNDVNDIEQK
jgi:hypothetical protein